MAHLMVGYQDPNTYALMDLNREQFDLIGRALRELLSLYERMEASSDQTAPIETLIAVVERIYDDTE